MAPLVRDLETEVTEYPIEVLAPCDGNRGGPDGVLEDQIPPDDPRNELAHRRVGIGVRAARDRNHRRELRVAETRERAANPRHDERERDRRARAFGDRGGRPNEDAGPDDAADAERHERPWTQRPTQRVFARRTRNDIWRVNAHFGCVGIPEELVD